MLAYHAKGVKAEIWEVESGVMDCRVCKGDADTATASANKANVSLIAGMINSFVEQRSRRAATEGAHLHSEL